MTDHLPQLMLAWSIQFMGVISPGPGIMLILSVAMSRGRIPSLITAFGIACASIVLSTTTVLGLTVIMAEAAGLVTFVRYLGAIYLIWLACKAFRTAAWRPELGQFEAPQRGAWGTGLTGFVLQLSNPKALFFWLAVASVGGVGNAPASATALFIAGAFVISFAGHGGYAWLLSSAPLRRIYERFRSWVEGTLGCFFLYAGYKLATSSDTH